MCARQSMRLVPTLSYPPCHSPDFNMVDNAFAKRNAILETLLHVLPTRCTDNWIANEEEPNRPSSRNHHASASVETASLTCESYLSNI